jgi:hypothetical protein
MEGGARHLTADEVIESLENQKRDREQEEAEKEKRREDRAELAECKQMLESRWQEICAEHKQAVEDHDAECARLLALGTRKKNLPPKPKRQLKKLLMLEYGLGNAEDGTNEQDVTDEVTPSQGAS